ncbi:unnamed protein product [Mycena citricolor]|uniref:ATP-dependent DNA helicase n=1 Tax=Mycena citricolor TaxID=2018698 RepID=A0AAD2K0A1_9AGAR|nr:unnamed protein product [Mycena citricolor]
MLAGNLMPRPPAVLASTIAVTYIGVGKLPKNWLLSTFRVRRQVVHEALRWLKRNNPKYYGHIEIDNERLAALPEDDVPLEISSLLRQSDDVAAVVQESDTYVREHHVDEQAETLEAHELDGWRDDGAGRSDDEDDDGGPDVIPLTVTGTIDTDLSSMSTNEMMQWGLSNMWNSGQEGVYAVRHGSKPVSDFGRPPRDGGPEPADPNRPNFFERAFPCLFPYGVGGLEADRPVDVTFAEHVKWSLQYHDRRFRRHETYPFVAFGISQRRQALLSARLQMRRKDFDKDARILSTITAEALEKSRQEEQQKLPISNPAVRLLRRHIHTAVGRVQGSNESRTVLRSQVWSTTLYTGPWNLWITINPSDIHDPIAQVFAGERVNLDEFVSTAGPDSDQRGRNIAADPYAAAKFFHFTIRTILETLLGVRVSGSQVHSEMGVLGEVAAYFGMVEGQNRAALHFHLIAALRNAPNADEMQDLLQSAAFREKIAAYIKENMRAYVAGLESEDAVKQIPVEKDIAYNRPPNPDSDDYTAQLAAFERRLARTEQVHTCDIRRCLVVTKSGRLRCKRRAPFACSDHDFIHSDGNWGPKRLYAFMNGWNPAILVNARCNNDIKLLTHGEDTKKVTLYIVGYATKPQLRHQNISAILAKGYAYHLARQNEAEGEKVRALRETQQLLLFRLIHAINREQELGAPMVISYLMGWGDNYHSHRYVPIYWSSFVSELLSSVPDLRSNQQLSDEHATVPHSESSTQPPVTGDPSADDQDAEDAEQANVTLKVDGRGRLYVKNQISDYIFRSEELECHNVMDYFVNTYEVEVSVRDQALPTAPVNAQRGRPKSTRFRYLHGHPSRNQKQRVLRSGGHNTLPNFIGPWFPRRDDNERRDFYCASMLMLLKPWRKLEDDLKTNSQSWQEAFAAFLESAPERTCDLLANIQFYHSCQSAALASQDDDLDDEDVTYDQLPTNESNFESFDEDADQVAITQNRIKALLESQTSNRESAHGRMAIEIARLVKLFDAQPVKLWPVDSHDAERTHALPATGNDLSNLIKWRRELDRVVQVQNDMGARAEDSEDEERPESAQETNDVLPSVEMIADNIEAPEERKRRSFNGDTANNDVDPSKEEEIVLQPDQQRAYDIIVWHLKHTLAGHGMPPLRMLIHGEGGTGKSKVITKATQAFRNRGVSSWLIKAAYTGVAASLIDGKTTHVIGGISLKAKKMSDATRSKLQDFWKTRRYLIIDEVSMLSKDFFAILSRNIGVGKSSSTDKSFGGINVILCGDFHQFPPVAKSINQALYYPTGGALQATSNDGRFRTAGKMNDTVDTKIGRVVYEEFTTVVILKQQMRVSDPVWLDFLRHLRIGDVEEEHLAMLRTLVLNPSEKLDDGWLAATLVTPRHGVRIPWNEEATRRMCAKNRTQLYVCQAEDTYRGSELNLADRLALAEHLTKHKRGGNSVEKELPYTIELAVGMELMVTSNIETDLDLTNGARGTIEEIILDPDEPPIGQEAVVHLTRLPVFILVKFERTRAGKLSNLTAGVIPVEPGKATYHVKTTISGGASVTKTIRRRQYPVTGAYAFTDYRSQGQTLGRVIIDIATPPSGGLSLFNLYVALSRSSGRETIRLLREFDDKIFRQSHDPALLAEDDNLERLNAVTKEWWKRMSTNRTDVNTE